MLGFYDYTVILTYASFLSAVSGIFCCLGGRVSVAIICLVISGICDLFDGKVAHTKKDRTQDEKSFGIQIDSLCDLVAFGVLPIAICYRMGMDHAIGMVVLALYGLAGVIRLAFYNVSEAKRQAETTAERHVYNGLPITTVSLILPTILCTAPLFHNPQVFVLVLHICMGVLGLLFVLNFRLRKMQPRHVVLLAVGIAVLMTALLLVLRGGRWLPFMHHARHG